MKLKTQRPLNIEKFIVDMEAKYKPLDEKGYLPFLRGGSNKRYLSDEAYAKLFILLEQGPTQEGLALKNLKSYSSTLLEEELQTCEYPPSEPLGIPPKPTYSKQIVNLLDSTEKKGSPASPSTSLFSLEENTMNPEKKQNLLLPIGTNEYVIMPANRMPAIAGFATKGVFDCIVLTIICNDKKTNSGEMFYGHFMPTANLAPVITYIKANRDKIEKIYIDAALDDSEDYPLLEEKKTHVDKITQILKETRLLYKLQLNTISAYLDPHEARNCYTFRLRDGSGGGTILPEADASVLNQPFHALFRIFRGACSLYKKDDYPLAQRYLEDSTQWGENLLLAAGTLSTQNNIARTVEAAITSDQRYQQWYNSLMSTLKENPSHHEKVSIIKGATRAEKLVNFMENIELWPYFLKHHSSYLEYLCQKNGLSLYDSGVIDAIGIAIFYCRSMQGETDPSPLKSLARDIRDAALREQQELESLAHSMEVVQSVSEENPSKMSNIAFSNTKNEDTTYYFFENFEKSATRKIIISFYRYASVISIEAEFYHDNDFYNLREALCEKIKSKNITNNKASILIVRLKYDDKEGIAEFFNLLIKMDALSPDEPKIVLDKFYSETAEVKEEIKRINSGFFKPAPGNSNNLQNNSKYNELKQRIADWLSNVEDHSYVKLAWDSEMYMQCGKFKDNLFQDGVILNPRVENLAVSYFLELRDEKADWVKDALRKRNFFNSYEGLKERVIELFKKNRKQSFEIDDRRDIENCSKYKNELTKAGIVFFADRLTGYKHNSHPLHSTYSIAISADPKVKKAEWVKSLEQEICGYVPKRRTELRR